MDDPQSPLILASQSPRRKSLMHEYGYSFLVHPPSDTAEGGMCSGETPPELVVRLAKQKAEDVAKQYEHAVIIGCDTVAECMGTVLGKPVDIADARRMLTMLRGKDHRVLSGLCIWKRPSDAVTLKLDITTLHMDNVTDSQVEEYLATEKWQGKAGAFGYQDGWDWMHVIQGSATNVIGLPMEVLADALSRI